MIFLPEQAVAQERRCSVECGWSPQSQRSDWDAVYSAPSRCSTASAPVAACRWASRCQVAAERQRTNSNGSTRLRLTKTMKT